jgi:hypothetical protein
MKQLREQIRSMDKEGRKSGTRMRSPPEMQLKKDSDSYNEEYNVVQTMWDDLGVTEDYRQIFDSIAIEMDDRLRKEFFETEVSSMMRLSENLTKLNREVQSREKSMIMLHKFDEAFSRFNEVSEKIINDMKQCVKNIRIQSINIVNHFNKIREICSYEIIGGKFDLDKINKVYNFDRNYLIKMKFDLEFLKSSSLENFFNISRGWDPFLQSLAEKKEGKISVEINQDMLNSIKNCQFLIIQDIVFYQMALKTSQSQEPYDTLSGSRSLHKFKLNYPLAKRGRINSPPLRPTSSNAYGYYNLNLNKNNRQYNSLFFTKEAINSIPAQKNKRIQIETKDKDSKSIENLKTFQQKINKVKENQITNEKIIHNYNSHSARLKYNIKNNQQTKETEPEISPENDKYKEVKNISNIPVIENHDTDRKADQNYSDNYNLNSENFNESPKETKLENDKISQTKIEERNALDIKENIQKKNLENVEETIIVKNQYENEMEEDIKYDFEENFGKLENDDHYVNKNSPEQKSQIKNNINQTSSTHKIDQIMNDEHKQKDHAQDETYKNQVKIISQNNEIKNDFNNNFTENYVCEIIEEEFKEKPNNIEISTEIKKSNDKDQSVVEEKIVYKKLHNDEEDEIHIQSKNREINLTEVKSQVNDFIFNVLTPKNINKNNSDSNENNNKDKENFHKSDSPLKIEFYNKNLEEFNEKYQEFYSSIPEEQKICFKPTKDIQAYVKGINPKIITAYKDSEVIGLCFVNYECYSNTIVRISINQLTCKETSQLEGIFKIFIDKIFSDLKCDEITIDIHYQLIDGTFKMNKDIFSILKEKIGFKWSHLENKTAVDRLQKMILKKPQYVGDLSIKDSLLINNATNVIVSQEKKEFLGKIDEKDVNAFMLIYSLVQLKNSDFVLENEHFNNFDFTKLKVRN